MRVFLDLACGDEGAAARIEANYRATTEFLAKNSACGFPASPSELEGDMLELATEMFAADPAYADATFTAAPPPPVHVGRLVVELDAAAAPRAVENFRALCTGEKGAVKGVRGKQLHYKGCGFHRATDTFIHGGDITRGDGSGGASIYGKKFKDEPRGLAVRHDGAGIVGFANSGKNSNTSQFYVTLRPAPALDGSHVVVGRVVEGLPVLEEVDRRIRAHRASPGATAAGAGAGASDGGGETGLPRSWVADCGQL